MNPLKFLSGISLQSKLILIAVLIFASFTTGWKVHNWKVDSATVKTVAKQNKVVEKLDKPRTENVKNKIDQTQRIEYVTKTIYKKIAELDDDRVCFTADSLKLWNDAIAGADSHRREPVGKSSEDEAFRTAEKDNDEVVATVKEVLANAADNYETCNKNIVRHQALINEVRLLQPNMCVCAQ